MLKNNKDYFTTTKSNHSEQKYKTDVKKKPKVKEQFPEN